MDEEDVRKEGQSGRRRPTSASEVQAFLSMHANERRVVAATDRQALSALLFLYARCTASTCRACSSSVVPSRTSASPSS
jgi:hypothetical protein